MQQSGERSFYHKFRKNRLNNMLVTIINPLLFTTAFIIGAIKSARSGKLLFMLVSLLTGSIFLLLLAANLLSRLTGRGMKPDIVITGTTVSVSRGPLRKPKTASIASIGNIEMPQDDNLIIIRLKNGRQLPINLSMFDEDDSAELAGILEKLADK